MACVKGEWREGLDPERAVGGDVQYSRGEVIPAVGPKEADRCERHFVE